MIGILLLACGLSTSSENTDIASYTASSLAPDLSSGLAHCDAIDATALRSECVAFQVRKHAREDTSASETACEQLPQGLWRDECFFLLADGAIDATTPSKTAPYCKRAGRYFQPCFMHLFKAHAGQLRSTLSQEKAQEAYALAVNLGGSEAPKDFAHRAWSVFFRSSGGEDRRYDTTGCADLDELSGACISGVREALARRLNRTAAPPNLCAIDPTRVSAWMEVLDSSMGITIAEDPTLLAVLEPFHRRHCPPLRPPQGR